MNDIEKEFYKSVVLLFAIWMVAIVASLAAVAGLIWFAIWLLDKYGAW